MQTVFEAFGTVQVPMAFVGDASSNMGRSFAEAAGLFNFPLTFACPEGYEPPAAECGPNVRIVRDPHEAVKGARVVNTDVWTSMGQEAESKKRLVAFAGFTVDSAMMAKAASDAIVLHCLPAHRGEEISAEVLEGPASRVWDQAENRMHAQKALLEILLAPHA
jgi:ornithine carbamoyltransferase